MIPAAKICKRCAAAKPARDFPITRGKPNKKGIVAEHLYPYCKECTRARAKENYYNNIPRARAAKAANYAKNKERDCAYARKYRSENRQRNAELDKAYKSANRPRLTAAQNERHERNRVSTPKWLSFVDRFMIRELYEIASARSVQTGVKHHVDHIFPLKGNGFCGLNVPWNLQVIEASKNVRKWRNIPTEFSGMFWSAA